MSVRGLARLATRCHELAAPGTDPDCVARVLAWAVRPRRGTDLLRRRCRDARPRPSGSQAGFARWLLEQADPELDATDVACAEPLLEAWLALGCRLALVGDPGYPPRLAEGWPDSDGPVWLVSRGSSASDAPAVAIVGARRASAYGTAIAAWLAEAASRAGARVVSGGALGIDAAAHRAALGLPGGTTVVLGCGHRVPYPRPLATPGGLFDAVLEDAGELVSELLPDEPPRAGAVRARNRIVAALADVVVVVEGGGRSGSLLTAGAAAERGRVVLAVPGDVRAPGSVGPHRLLHEGVAPCTGPDELLDALASLGHATASGPTDATTAQVGVDRGRSVLPDAVRGALAAAWPRPMRIEDLAAISGHPLGALLAAVTRGRVAGELAEDGEGIRLRRPPAR